MESPPSKSGSEEKKSGSGASSSERSTSIVGSSEEKNSFEFFGWVYHLGVNSIGHDYRHLRFLFIRGKYVSMYKRDPHENPGIVCFSSFSSFLLFFRSNDRR